MDEVLFVCVNNVGRSQWAMEEYNRLRPGEAKSAGTTVDEPGGFVEDWKGGPGKIIEVAVEDGVDIGHNRRTQLSEKMLSVFGIVVVMAEERTWDDFLKSHIEDDNILVLPMPDPVNMPIEAIRRIRQQIKIMAQDLAQNTSKMHA